jgi:hypothetical protein
MRTVSIFECPFSTSECMPWTLILCNTQKSVNVMLSILCNILSAPVQIHGKESKDFPDTLYRLEIWLEIRIRCHILWKSTPWQFTLAYSSCWIEPTETFFACKNSNCQNHTHAKLSAKLQFSHTGTLFHSWNEGMMIHSLHMPLSAFEMHFEHECWMKWYSVNVICQLLRVFFITGKSHCYLSSEILERMISSNYSIKSSQILELFSII